MAGSLFDQLKNVGLIDEQKAKKAKKDKQQQAKQNKSQKGGKEASAPTLSDAARQAAETARKKAERDRQLNLERQQQQARKAAQAEIRQVVEANRLTDYAGNRQFYFADDRWMKTLNIAPDVRRRLVSGSLRIVRTDGGFALIPQVAAEKVAQRDPSALIPLARADDEAIPEPDRAHYARFKVPDDLVW